MKITEYNPIKSTSSVKKRGGASSIGSFADLLAAAESQDAPPVSDVAAPGGINSLLALQEISGEEARRRTLVTQGSDMLDVLEKLRQQLLLGTLPLHTLRDLNRQLSIKKQLVNDPMLTALIEEIEIRAAVELAKVEVALERSNGVVE